MPDQSDSAKSYTLIFIRENVSGNLLEINTLGHLFYRQLFACTVSNALDCQDGDDIRMSLRPTAEKLSHPI